MWEEMIDSERSRKSEHLERANGPDVGCERAIKNNNPFRMIWSEPLQRWIFFPLKQEKLWEKFRSQWKLENQEFSIEHVTHEMHIDI